MTRLHLRAAIAPAVAIALVMLAPTRATARLTVWIVPMMPVAVKSTAALPRPAP